jgi:hypothetical protein
MTPWEAKSGATPLELLMDEHADFLRAVKRASVEV